MHAPLVYEVIGADEKELPGSRDENSLEEHLGQVERGDEAEECGQLGNHVEVVVVVVLGGLGGHARIHHHEYVGAYEPEGDQGHEAVKLVHAVHGEAERDGQKVETE